MKKKTAAKRPEPESSSLVGTTKDGEKLISIAFPERHWVVLLAAIHQVNELAQRKIGELREQGITDINTLPKETITSLAAPLIIRGVIVKELAAHGVMTPEANAREGIDQVLDSAQESLAAYRRKLD